MEISITYFGKVASNSIIIFSALSFLALALGGVLKPTPPPTLTILLTIVKLKLMAWWTEYIMSYDMCMYIYTKISFNLRRQSSGMNVVAKVQENWIINWNGWQVHPKNDRSYLIPQLYYRRYPPVIRKRRPRSPLRYCSSSSLPKQSNPPRLSYQIVRKILNQTRTTPSRAWWYGSIFLHT